MGLAWRSGLHLQMFHHVFFLWLSVAHIGWNIMMVLVPKKNPRWWFQISFMFTPGERIQFDLSIFFQVGWFNHQLEAFSRNDRGSTSWSSSYCRHRCHSPRGDWLNKVAEDVIGAYDVFPGTSPGKNPRNFHHFPGTPSPENVTGRVKVEDHVLIIFQAMRLWVYILPGSNSNCQGTIGCTANSVPMVF